MKKYIYLLILAPILLASTCKEDPANDKKGNCSSYGTVVDLTGLDGCGLAIELGNGSKLEVAKMPDGLSLHKGKKIRFDYVVSTDYASICMVGQIVEITCYEEL